MIPSVDQRKSADTIADGKKRESLTLRGTRYVWCVSIKADSPRPLWLTIAHRTEVIKHCSGTLATGNHYAAGVMPRKQRAESKG